MKMNTRNNLDVKSKRRRKRYALCIELGASSDIARKLCKLSVEDIICKLAEKINESRRGK